MISLFGTTGAFYFLSVDFSKRIIQIYRYYADSQKLETVEEMPLELVADCYNLMLKTSPLMLCQAPQNGSHEIVWPEKRTITIGETEALLFRDGEELYFSEWYEDPEYHENVIVRDLNTGEIKEKFKGYVCKMPNGVYWRIESI